MTIRAQAKPRQPLLFDGSDTMDEKKLMSAAIAEARAGVSAGQSPFGAVVARNGKILASGHNTVLRDNDPTAHAEMNVIRAACKAAGKWELSGCIVYSTGEPCPMCFSACHWARVSGIVYGFSTKEAGMAGFNELQISDLTLKRLGKDNVSISGGFMKKECLEVLREWKEKVNRTY